MEYNEQGNRIRVLHDFTYHAPADQSVDSLRLVRQGCKNLAMLILDQVPMSRERSLAITKLEEALMWANAGIVRGQQ